MIEPTPEYRVLLAATRPGEPPPGAPAGAVDWSLVSRLARHHRLEGLLHRHVERIGATVPGHELDAWCAVRQRIAARELMARAQLGEVASALAGQGIRPVALKGAALIETVYPEPGLRVLTDLDLLVSRADLERAVLTLGEAGYATHPYWRDVEMHDAFGRHAPHHHVPLSHPERPLVVELHHTITASCVPASTTEMLARATAHPGSPLLLPAASDLLIHLGAHFSGDRILGSDGALGQLADLAHTIDRHPIAWDALAPTARRFGCDALVFLALRTVAELELARVPAAVLAALEPESFSPEIGARLIADRVLVEGPRRAALAVLPRTLREALLPSRTYLETGHRLPGASLPRLYLARVRAAARLVVTAAGNPRRSRGELVLDRWIRRQSAGHGP